MLVSDFMTSSVSIISAVRSILTIMSTVECSTMGELTSFIASMIAVRSYDFRILLSSSSCYSSGAGGGGGSSRSSSSGGSRQRQSTWWLQLI